MSEPRVGAYAVCPKAVVQAMYIFVRQLVFFQGGDHDH